MSGLAPDADSPLARLLDLLARDGRDAGDAYESLRRLLTRYFEVRRIADADRCCDDVLDRLARRAGDGTVIDDAGAYALGIARLVALEAGRRPQPVPLAREPEAPRPDEDHDPAAAVCLDRCLAQLADDDRTHLLTYYTAEGRARIETRRALARTLGVSATALRLRMLRMRFSLERCVTGCLASSGRNVRGTRSTLR